MDVSFIGRGVTPLALPINSSSHDNPSLMAYKRDPDPFHCYLKRLTKSRPGLLIQASFCAISFSLLNMNRPNEKAKEITKVKGM